MTRHFSFFKLDYSAILSAKCVCVYVVYTISILNMQWLVHADLTCCDTVCFDKYVFLN